jgi:NADH-quinone oxidoreductase subunit J
MNILFLLLALIAVASAAGVVALRQPLYSAFCLVINLLTIAAFFAMLDAHFLAVAQVIVYAGAIMVLVVFVIMLLSLQASERKPPPFLLVIIAMGAAAAFLRLLFGLFDGAFGGEISGTAFDGSVQAIGRVLFTKYLFPFEAASLLIIAAMVGAVMLAQKLKNSSHG